MTLRLSSHIDEWVVPSSQLLDRRPLKKIPLAVTAYIQSVFSNTNTISFFSCAKGHCGFVYGKLKGGGVASSSQCNLIRTFDGKVIDVIVVVKIDEEEFVVGNEMKVVESEWILKRLKQGKQSHDLFAKKCCTFLYSLKDFPLAYDWLSSVFEITNQNENVLTHCSINDMETKLIALPIGERTYTISWVKQEELH